LVGYGKNPPNPPYRIDAILMANWNKMGFFRNRSQISVLNAGDAFTQTPSR